jgi:hypothetical protein
MILWEELAKVVGCGGGDWTASVASTLSFLWWTVARGGSGHNSSAPTRTSAVRINYSNHSSSRNQDSNSRLR